MINHTYFATRAAARLTTFEYIEGWYNGTGRPAPTEAFNIELRYAQSAGILFLHFLNGRIKILQYTVASPSLDYTAA